MPQPYNLAKESLRLCYSPIGYVAGQHHFVDLWARDSLFACLGNLNSDEARQTIETFFAYQRKDGLIPYRIRRSRINIQKYFGHPSFLPKPVADFRSFQSLGTVYDGGLMLLFVVGEYYKKTQDIEFVRKYQKQIERIGEYYRKKFPNKLISEWFLCEWADAVMKAGKVLYTNVLYLLALRATITLLEACGESVNEVQAYSKSIESQFKKTFWNGEYFSDWHDYKRQDYLAAFPNLLAIYYNIASASESKSIYKQITQECLTDVGVRSNHPKYPFWRIPLLNYLCGVPDYHNGIFWLQPWVYYILVAAKLGDIETSKRESAKLSEQILKYPVIYENYERDWSFLDRRMYRAEGAFAWSSGLIAYMFTELNGGEE